MVSVFCQRSPGSCQLVEKKPSVLFCPNIWYLVLETLASAINWQPFEGSDDEQR